MKPFSFACTFLVSIALSLAASAVNADPGDDMGSERIAVSPEIERKTAAFLQHFIDADKTPEQQASLFAPNAEYYDLGKTSRREIERDVAYYIRRWPMREYELTDIHYITPDPESDRVFVSYEIAFTVGRESKTVSGTAAYGAVIANLNDSPKVEWIKENIQRQKRDSLSGSDKY